MTVQEQDLVQYYDGPISSGTVLSIVEFTFLENSHVAAKIRGLSDNLVYGTDYTVSGMQSLNRTITLLTDIADTEVLAVFLDVPITQGVSPEEGGNMPAATQEYSLDKLTQICAKLYERVTRAFQASIDSTFDGTLYELNDNPGKALIVNATGTGIDYSDESLANIVSTVEDLTGEATTQAGIATTQAGTATIQAGIATTQAGLAAGSAAQAEADKNSISAGLAQLNGIGTLANLLTAAKNNLVESINELFNLIWTKTDPDVQALGDITVAPTLAYDMIYSMFIKNAMTIALPTGSTGKLKNLLLDFNLQPGRTLTLPTNIRWDFNATPTFTPYPNVLLNLATLNNMVLTFLATSNQYADLYNVPFYSLGSQPWKRIWKVTPTQVGVLNYFTSCNTSVYQLPVLGITTANKHIWYVSSNGTTSDIVNGVTGGAYTVTNNTPYFVKEEFTGTHYKLETCSDYNVATDVGTWVQDIAPIASTTPMYSANTTSAIRLGSYINGPTTNLFKGTIDLANSCVKIAGGPNILLNPPRPLNRCIFDTIDGGTTYKGYYCQVEV